MATIIAFSKDRPLQLHAYLESMLMYSDIKPEQINIIYLQTGKISYDKVIVSFPKINFIRENSFIEDIYRCLDRAEDFILFGVDDAVFTRPFSINKAEKILCADNEIYGYSLRLGKDIIPNPDKSFKECDDFLLWNWKETSAVHYNYPWEVVATLYRKLDVLDMLAREKREKIKTPSFLEGIPYSPEFFTVGDYGSKRRTFDFVKKPLMACNKLSSAIIITVNRVQDDFPNEFDEIYYGTPGILNDLYNNKDDTLNIQAISKLPHNQPHVNSDFFILRRSKMIYFKRFSRSFIVKIILMIKKTIRIFKKIVKNVLPYFIVKKYIAYKNGKMMNHQSFTPPPPFMTSLSDDNKYPNFCLEASTDPYIFSNFRQSEIYRVILEHVSFDMGQRYLDEIKRTRSDLLKDIDKIKENDRYGNPDILEYDLIGKICPSTLRYTKVMADLLNLFGTLDGLKICEIGVGYGGQCRVINSIAKPAEYTLVDIKPALLLTQRYLDNYILSSAMKYKTIDELVKDDYDLLISNYAFTELRREIQEVYLEKMILNAKSGYITYNEITPEYFRSYKKDELLKIIPNARIIEEVPLGHKANCIIIWGEK